MGRWIAVGKAPGWDDLAKFTRLRAMPLGGQQPAAIWRKRHANDLVVSNDSSRPASAGETTLIR